MVCVIFSSMLQQMRRKANLQTLFHYLPTEVSAVLILHSYVSSDKTNSRTYVKCQNTDCILCGPEKINPVVKKRQSCRLYYSIVFFFANELFYFNVNLQVRDIFDTISGEVYHRRRV